MVFDNRTGAGSTIGTEFGAKSAPDGYTLVLGIPAGVTIAPHIHAKLGYDPLKDLVPVAGFATSPLVMVVPTDSPFKTFADLVAAARAKPGELTYASNGSGSLPHLSTEWLLSLADLKLTHVPYRGSSQALPDLIAGRTDVMMDILVSALPLIEGGKLRVLAVTDAQPTARLPWCTDHRFDGVSGLCRGPPACWIEARINAKQGDAARPICEVRYVIGSASLASIIGLVLQFLAAANLTRKPLTHGRGRRILVTGAVIKGPTVTSSMPPFA